MQIDLNEVRAEDHALLEHLGQFYAYDFSEITGTDLPESGRFASLTLEDLDDPGYVAYLVRVDGSPAGFAIVHRGSFFERSDADLTDMDEFFVMRKYRRSGVGAEVAKRLFDLYPGRWEVREVALNVAAQAFWRRVIGEYTGGAYHERIVENERWNGPVQSFVTNGRRS
jgi:predicted acetyltransferase